MSMSWTFQGKEYKPDAEDLRAAIDGVFAEADREERPLTTDEKEDVAELYEELDKLSA